MKTSTTEMVLDFLRKEGFCPDVQDNGDVVFKYQMSLFLYVNNSEDEEFFQLVMPAICDVTEDNREIMLEAVNKLTMAHLREAINKLNFSMKVVKATIFNDEVWLFFENILDNSPEVGDIIRRALSTLQGARHKFHEIIS